MNNEKRARAKISINEGLIELEGSEEFVEKYLIEFKNKLSFPSHMPTLNNHQPSAQVVQQKKDSANKVSAVRPAKSKGKNIEPEEFEINNNSDDSLAKFMESKNPGENAWNRIVVVGYYITHKLQKANFTEGNVEFAYKALSLNKRPLHLRQAFIDMKNKKKWLEELSDGGWTLSRLGEIYVEDQMLPKS